MVAGVGIDMVETARVRQKCENKRFLDGVYTEAEQALIRVNAAAAADNFAVKEAVAKALGTGFCGFRPRDIEVLRRENGAPFVRLYAGADRCASARDISEWHISISNTKAHAVALAVAESKTAAETDA